ncbi:phage BR0599 family protein [Roseovarius sp. D22-M7]|uniref:phage BR0599 family protein n=1 Tax=Roseovarius sp. D22-M7 TaxID=3127116 RepID=UPI003FA78305
MTSAVKQVTVRLAAEGGRQVRAELKGIGEDGATAFQRLSSEMEAANARADRFFRRLRLAAAAGVSTCIDRFDNVLNFRGDPFVPGTDKLTETPNAR